MRMDFDFSAVVRTALAEDLGAEGDVSAEAVFGPDTTGRFVLLAKDSGVLCGLDAFAAVFAALDSRTHLDRFFEDGDALEPGAVVARAEGPVQALLSGERTALNLLSHLSGVATKARRFSDAAGGRLAVLDTRKTIPGLRALQKYAVRCGGCSNHRMGLFDMIMLKDNHVDAAGGVAEAVAKARSRWGGKFEIEVETRTIAEVRAAVGAGADRIMFDNMDDATMREAVAVVAGRAYTEASGNLTMERIPVLIDLGVDSASFGELTHGVKAFDFSFKAEARA